MSPPSKTSVNPLDEKLHQAKEAMQDFANSLVGKADKEVDNMENEAGKAKDDVKNEADKQKQKWKGKGEQWKNPAGTLVMMGAVVMATVVLYKKFKKN
jgi:hypothetical protein